MATENYVRVENLQERAIANQEYVTNKSEFNGCCGQIESVESSKNRLILIWSKNVSFPLKISRSA